MEWESLIVESLRMSTVTHTPADVFWRLPWPLYEAASKEAMDINNKMNGKGNKDG